jgi:hypothetical protein
MNSLNGNFGTYNMNYNKTLITNKTNISDENMEENISSIYLNNDSNRQFGKDLKNILKDKNLNQNFYFKIDKNYEKKENQILNNNRKYDTVIFFF